MSLVNRQQYARTGPLGARTFATRRPSSPILLYMNARCTHLGSTQHSWRELYLLALFEPDKTKANSRITEAEKALIRRERELFTNPQDPQQHPREQRGHPASAQVERLATRCTGGATLERTRLAHTARVPFPNCTR